MAYFAGQRPYLDGNCVVSGKSTNGPCRAMRANEPAVETLFKDVYHIPLAQFQLVVVLQSDIDKESNTSGSWFMFQTKKQKNVS